MYVCVCITIYRAVYAIWDVTPSVSSHSSGTPHLGPNVSHLATPSVSSHVTFRDPFRDRPIVTHLVTPSVFNSSNSLIADISLSLSLYIYIYTHIHMHTYIIILYLTIYLYIYIYIYYSHVMFRDRLRGYAPANIPEGTCHYWFQQH